MTKGFFKSLYANDGEVLQTRVLLQRLHQTYGLNATADTYIQQYDLLCGIDCRNDRIVHNAMRRSHKRKFIDQYIEKHDLRNFILRQVQVARLLCITKTIADGFQEEGIQKGSWFLVDRKTALFKQLVDLFDQIPAGILIQRPYQLQHGRRYSGI